MDANEALAERFQEHRSRLRAVAYRMLGSLSEADDAVQEAWLRLSGAAAKDAGTGVQAALLSTAAQADGSSQVTYGGKPLYYFAGDAKAGDARGQGVGSVWFAVTADGGLVKEKAAGGGYP
jgi:hypothetical protein